MARYIRPNKRGPVADPGNDELGDTCVYIKIAARGSALSRGVWGHAPQEIFGRYTSSEIDPGTI